MPAKLINPTKEAILRTIPPPATRTYKTISHGQIIDSICDNLSKEGFNVVKERYQGSHNNQIIVGHLQLDINLDKDLKFEIGFMNSYNKMKKAIVIAGSSVFICGNGHILGDGSYGNFTRKHVGNANIKIDEFIPEMVKSASDHFQVLIKQKDRMKEIELDKKVRNELIGQLYLDEALITTTQMSIIKKEFKKSSFDYGTSPTSLWQTYNNITMGLKETHPSDWLSSHQKLNKIVNEKFQLV